MSRLTRTFTALGAVFFALTALSACGGSSAESVVQVGGLPITKPTFTHWLTVAANSSQQSATGAPKRVAVPVPPKYTACIAQMKAQAPAPAKGAAAPTDAQYRTQCAAQYQSLKGQVLQYLITTQWVFGEAKDQGINIPDKTVVARLDTVKKQQFPTPAAFNKFLAQSGETTADLLLSVKLNLLSAAIRTKVQKGKGNVTDAQVAAFYGSHQASFGKPETRDLMIILTKTQAQANAAKSAITHRTPFATEAKRVSIDPTSKANGGVLAGVARGQQEQSLDKAVFAAPLHALQGPVQTPFGYYIFEVQKVTPGTQQPLASVAATIRQQLVAQQQQQALQAFVATFTKKWTKRTDCSTQFVVQDCKQFKAPKTSAPGTTPGG